MSLATPVAWDVDRSGEDNSPAGATKTRRPDQRLKGEKTLKKGDMSKALSEGFVIIPKKPAWHENLLNYNQSMMRILAV